MHTSSIEQFYEKNAKKYLNFTNPNASPIPIIKQNALSCIIGKENIGLDNANIIDVGCGDGTYSRFLASKYPNIQKITGVDISNEMIKNAKAQNQNNSKISYYHGNILKLSTLTEQNVKLASYDIAVVIFIMPHASTKQEFAKMIENISLLLKPSGCIIGINTTPDEHRFINASTDDSYNKYGFKMNLSNGGKKLYDGCSYRVDLYLFDGSRSLDNPKGNFIRIENGHFYSRKIFNDYAQKFGFKQWEWYNYSVPSLVKQNHPDVDWNGYQDNSVAMPFYATKRTKYLSKL